MATWRPHVLMLAIALGVVVLLSSVQEASAIACSPYVYPCTCGLCPRIVDCAKKQSAECYCGRPGVKPGIYRHPSNKTKFWMCSVADDIKYGLEMTCPQGPVPFVFDPATKACSVPSTRATTPKTPQAPAAPTKPQSSPKPSSSASRSNSSKIME